MPKRFSIVQWTPSIISNVPDAGMFTGWKNGEHKSEVSCPYCREPMIEAMGAVFSRIRQIGRQISKDQWMAVLDHIPADYRALACAGCRQSFTLPKS